MDLTNPKTWTDGLELMKGALHIVVPLVIAVATFVWWFRGTFERSKRDGLQKEIKGRDEVINGRDVQIVGLNAQITDLNTKMSILQERLDAAKEQQSYLARKLADAETEIAKLKQQVEDRAPPEVVSATVNSTERIVDEMAAANIRLGNTISDPNLFDKRLKIYKTVKDCVDQAIINPLRFDNKLEKEFLNAFTEDCFLFGVEVHDYLENLRKDIVFVRDIDRLGPAIANANAAKRMQAMNRINKFYEDGQLLFAKYMPYMPPTVRPIP